MHSLKLLRITISEEMCWQENSLHDLWPWPWGQGHANAAKYSLHHVTYAATNLKSQGLTKRCIFRKSIIWPMTFTLVATSNVLGGDTLRLDRCHSWPLHTSAWMIDASAFPSVSTTYVFLVKGVFNCIYVSGLKPNQYEGNKRREHMSHDMRFPTM